MKRIQNIGGRMQKDFSPTSYLLSPTSRLRSHLRLIDLNKTTNFLISLIILLIKPVDKSVDKLWISCG
jgi:hypothetical protein